MKHKKNEGTSGQKFRLSRKQTGILAAVILVISISLFWFMTGREDGSGKEQNPKKSQETVVSKDQDKKNETGPGKKEEASGQEQSTDVPVLATQLPQSAEDGEVQQPEVLGTKKRDKNRNKILSDAGNTPAWKNDKNLTVWNIGALPGMAANNKPEPVPLPVVEPGTEAEDNYYTIRFESNGGDSISDLQLKHNTDVSDLPVPKKDGHIFLGWYKDPECQERWADGSRIQGDMTLYAAYTESEKLEETDGNVFVTRLDQNTDFTIGIQAKENMSAAQVREGINFEAVSEGTYSQTELLVEGSNGSFQVSGNGGFQEGATYQLTLEDENLSFAGEPDTAYIYSFTIKKDEVQNLRLDDDLIYIPADSVTEIKKDGENVSELSVPLAEADVNTGTAAAKYSKGSFTYKDARLSKGDTVVIYEGQRPDLREINIDSDQGAVAYVTITDIKGDTYSFETAEAEDVLFIPDILPVPEEYYDADMQFTIEEEFFDFSGDEYKGTGLDEETEIEEGDFLAFYSDDQDTVLRYGRIKEVDFADGEYDIIFENMDFDELEAAMDLYDSRDVDADQLLDDEDIAGLERSIEQQAYASGFVNEASSYLAGMALETEEVKRQMGSDFLSGRAGTSKVSVEDTKIKANISKNLKHFSGKSGVRCELQVTCTVKVSCSNRAEMKIKLTGTFIEEARLAINISSKTIWKWKWIFPYIYDYKLNANLDVYNFTGIDINATVATKSPSQKWGDPGTQEYYDIAQDIKKLMKEKNSQSGAIDAGVQKMTDRYHNMLQQESDWITLFDKKIFSIKGSIDPFHILAYAVNCSFVTKANLNASLGCAFEYEIGRRYSYVVELFHKNITNNTINLVDERYELEFYVMGTMGLRAGIRLEVELGLFSTALDSVGISAEVGAYVRMWGYFYYHLLHTQWGGTVSQSSGALLTEVGIYLEISFKAQVLKGTYQYVKKLYSKEWPLWSAGTRQNVYGFANTKVPVVDIRRSVKSYRLSDDVFKMNRMDLKTGKTSVGQYDDRTDFVISFTNKAFSYNPNTNIITVNSNRLVEDGEMIITWRKNAVVFSSKPLSRTIKLHWDNLADSYTINFNSMGGSAVPPISQKYGTKIIRPANPVREGYIFEGWYRDTTWTTRYTIPSTMQAENVTVYAKWRARTDVPYTIEYYQQNLENNDYTLVETMVRKGVTGSRQIAILKSYEGFTKPAYQIITIAGDGSGVVKYYYKRNIYQLTYRTDNGSDDLVYKLKYGQELITLENVTKTGYIFDGWEVSGADPSVTRMPANNLVFTAKWIICDHSGNTSTVSCGGGNCSVCKLDLPGEHKESSWIVDKEAACETEGERYRICLDCQEVLKKETIPMLGHQYGGWQTVSPAACETEGSREQECQVCQKKETEAIPQLGHKESEDWITDQEATCTANGERHKECTVCQKILEKETLPTIEHQYGNWQTVSPAACEIEGSRERECQACQKKETEAILQLGHKESEDWITDQEATCTTNGERHKECTICQKILEKETLPMLEHQYGEWQEVSSAACEIEGSRERECQACQKKETEAIPQLGHDYSQEWTIDQEASCTEDGEKSHHCLRCGSRSDIMVIPMTGHSYPDGSEYCSNCGYRNVTADTSWYLEDLAEIHLSKEGQLMGLAELVNSGNTFSGKTIILDNDLDLTAIPWVPIGNSCCRFSGKFNGGYHTISNLTIGSGTSDIGLFGGTYNAVMEAVGVSGASITVEHGTSIGGLIGNDSGGTEVRECFVTGSIIGSTGIGGIIGSTSGNGNPTRITNCYTRMTLQGTGGTLDVGGISGWNDSNSVLIINSYTASTGEKRPIAGWSDGAAVSEAFIINTWYDKTLSDTLQGLTALGKSTEELMLRETYVNWDFDSVWSMESGTNNGYPILKKYSVR